MSVSKRETLSCLWEFEPILLSGFPEAIGIPGLKHAIGLDAVEELVAIEEDRFRQVHRCWSRLGHNSVFFFLILFVSCLLLWSSLSS